MRIRTFLITSALATGAIAATALPVSASEACVDASVEINGDPVVNETHCEQLPGLPL